MMMSRGRLFPGPPAESGYTAAASLSRKETKRIKTHNSRGRMKRSQFWAHRIRQNAERQRRVLFSYLSRERKGSLFFYLFIYLQKRGDRLAADSSRVSDKSCCWSIHYLLQHILATRLWVMIRRGSRGCHVRNRKYIMNLSSPPLTYSNPRSVCWHVCGLNTTLK